MMDISFTVGNSHNCTVCTDYISSSESISNLKKSRAGNNGLDSASFHGKIYRGRDESWPNYLLQILIRYPASFMEYLSGI
jgi:hypothetical protein